MSHVRSLRSIVVFFVAALACASDRGGGDEGSGLGDGVPPADDGFSGDDGGDGGGVRFDTPGDGTGNGGDDQGGDGCEKVDFLFVIDNSGSMGDEQQNLTNSFPGFITTIQSTLMAQDYHVMVVDTDATGVDICATLCALLPDCNGVPCNMIPPAGPCDTTIGAGKLKDQGGAVCPIAGAKRYIVDGQTDLANVFACIAQVGTMGSGDEQQMRAMTEAVSPALNGPGGCNEGFLRDDAILVVTVITDEEDGPAGPDAANETPSPGNPPDWKQTLVTAKHGDENSVVVLGLVGDTGEPGSVCGPLDASLGTGAEPSPRLRQFVQEFQNGVLGSVCEPDYAPFFEAAVSVIDTACDDFTPPG